MFVSVLYSPALHGALGWWDELINLIPVVIGIVLVIYLYRNRRRGAAGAGEAGGAQADAEQQPETPEMADASEAPATRH